MSNSIEHYQTAPDLGVHCLLRYISVPIFGVNTVSFFAASDKNNNILIKVHSSIYKIVLLLANYMHH